MNKVVYEMGLLVGRYFSGNFATYEEVVEALEKLTALAREMREDIKNITNYHWFNYG